MDGEGTPATRALVAAMAAAGIDPDDAVFVWGDDPDEPQGDMFVVSEPFAAVILERLEMSGWTITRQPAAVDPEHARFDAMGGLMMEGADA